MTFALWGVNHNSAPVEVRERFAIPQQSLPDATRALALQPDIEEAMIVSTCNRVELLVRSRNGSANLAPFLSEYLKLSPADYDRCLYRHQGKDAVRHLFRVACSLDSMVVGEPQILGQVKEAYATAQSVGAVHSQLGTLVTSAFAVAKRVRTETAIGSSVVSVASVAVELAKKIFGSLDRKSVCLVGAGKMSELAARHLVAQGAGRILVANRTRASAERLAASFEGEVIAFEDLYAHLDRADIVITSTGAPQPIFRREHAEAFMARRRNRPMFFIDIAVPRDVDVAMGKLDGVFVYDIDDLQSVVATHAADRRREAQRAEAIVGLEVEKFLSRLSTQAAVPTIVSLQAHLEGIRCAELERVRGKLGGLTPEQQAAIEGLTRGIINKVLHTPISTLKSAAQHMDDPGASAAIDLIRRLFNLDRENSAPPKSKAASCDTNS
ncbi:MAG: glutamyl-tRNA reductase [Acidobacteria bacterium]|nr:glutamyl-tRNA reductase [Acidobacteriota bacterium]